MLKFKVSPSVRAAAIPTGTGFGAFDGLTRHCKEYAKVKGGVLRCAVYKEGRGAPACPTKQSGLKLVDGGRSPGLVRKGVCEQSRPGKTSKKAAPKRKAPKARKARK